MTVQYRIANSDDFKNLERLLVSCLLPPDDLEDALTEEGALFIVAEDDTKIIGSVGLQQYGANALVRSFAVDYFYRGSLVTSRLMMTLEKQARVRKISAGYLLTTTITNFLLRHGFELYDRRKVPSAIASTEQFSSVCPDTAICMRRKLD